MTLNDVDIYSKFPDGMKKVYYGMGCFWGAEKKFWGLSGVHTTIVGYCGGGSNNPTYEEVCSGKTGHAEVVRVVYDDSKINLVDLLKVFWESHDPTQLNRHGNDFGTQYRSAIFLESNDDLKLAQSTKLKFQNILSENDFGSIKTEIGLLKNFFFAEEYHQKYLQKNPSGYCALSGLGVNYFN